MENSVATADNGHVTINIPAEDVSNTQQSADAPVTTTNDQTPARRRPCCLTTRRCLESSYFSFTLGGLIFLGGVVLVAVSSQMPEGDYFLIGPFCIVAGAILIIKGTVSKAAKRQQRREQAEREERITNRALTRAQRSQRNEELALSQENLIIPPDYFESVAPPKTIPPAPVHRQLVNSESQTAFDLPAREGSIIHVSQHVLQRLTSVQSQTSFPSTASIGVDTSDLPVQLDAVSQAPPSYERAITRQTSLTIARPEAGPVAVTYYIPTDEDDTGTSTTTQSTGT